MAFTTKACLAWKSILFSSNKRNKFFWVNEITSADEAKQMQILH